MHSWTAHSGLSPIAGVIMKGALLFTLESTCCCAMALIISFPLRSAFKLKSQRWISSSSVPLKTEIFLSTFWSTLILLLNGALPASRCFQIKLISILFRQSICSGKHTITAGYPAPCLVVYDEHQWCCTINRKTIPAWLCCHPCQTSGLVLHDIY